LNELTDDQKRLTSMTEGELPLVERNSKLAGEYDKEQLLRQRSVLSTDLVKRN